MRFSFWLTFVLLFSVSANTSRNAQIPLEIDVSRAIVCGDTATASSKNEAHIKNLSLTIFPKSEPQDGWFKSDVSIVEEGALLHEFTMNCVVRDLYYFCYWDQYYHIALDLENMWVEKITSEKNITHFTGAWKQGAFKQPRVIYCSQIN